jgi:hypothetical protein
MAEILGTNNSESLPGNDYDDSIFAFGGDDVLWGLGGNDYLSGGAGADVLLGMNGEDILYGGTGGDRLAGGSSMDVFIRDVFRFDLGDSPSTGVPFSARGPDYITETRQKCRTIRANILQTIEFASLNLSQNAQSRAEAVRSLRLPLRAGRPMKS